MKAILLFFCLISAQFISAQIFSAIPTTHIPFESVNFAAIAFSDVDGDNDQDVLFTGLMNSGRPISKLYTNDGSGNFTEQLGTPFDAMILGDIAFADVDGDSDQDVLMVGDNGSGGVLAKLYINNGHGIFAERVGAPFVGARSSSIAFADVDGDNDQDVLITGEGTANPIAKLYINDGSGIFTESLGTPFDGVFISSIAFADVDGDSDQDVLITGRRHLASSISKLYINDGNGNFTEVTGTPFYAVENGDIAFTDVDGDSDQDVLITGDTGFFSPISRLYLNDGSGNFSEKVGTPFEDVYYSSIAFADVDGDSDQDVLIAGDSTASVQLVKLYVNDGNGNFTEVTALPFEASSYADIAFADIDGDRDQDILIAGSYLSGKTSRLYENTSISAALPSPESLTSLGRLYPNPSLTRQVNLDCIAQQNTGLKITVFDLLGNLILSKNVPVTSGSHSLQFDFSALKKGMYFVHVRDGASTASLKLLLQ